jgi:tripartite-type tricarboxylate transporter receptor subunit TctC
VEILSKHVAQAAWRISAWVEEKYLEETMKLLKLATILAMTAMGTVAHAQNYPSKPVTLVVPFAPGGSNDIVGRYLADGLSKKWGQPVVVENKPGAGAAIGSAHVAKSKPDGYTMLIASVTFTMNPAVQKNLPFDPAKDLTPVAMLGSTPLVLGVGAAVKANNIEEFLKIAKEKDLIYAATGPGSVNQFAAELINENAGLDMDVAHYKGGSEAMTDVIGGHVDLYVGSINQMLPQFRAGQLRGLAVTSPERSPAMPDTPTLKEAGIPNSEIQQWWGIMVPAGTPDDVVQKLNADINEVMGSDAGKEFLSKDGAVPSRMTAKEYQAFVSDELTKWKGIAERTGIVQ